MEIAKLTIKEDKIAGTEDIPSITGRKTNNASGYVFINRDEKIFIPDWHKNSFDNLKQMNKINEDILNTLKTLITTMQSGILPSNTGGPIVSPTFVADLTQLTVEIEQKISKTAQDIEKLNEELV